MKREKRGYSVTVKLTEEEKKKIEEFARDKGFTISSFIRYAVLQTIELEKNKTVFYPPRA